ncbi:MAG: transposase [Planctomycetota bacterium]
MGRRPREDEPGGWSHVFNRRSEHRPVFDSDRVRRFFLSRVARSVKRGEIEVHAYVLMTTHFHMLVRSPRGELSIALKRIESEFVRWFNWLHGCDGALFRGRFGSKRVKSLDYRRILVRYIDQNPVASGMVKSPEEYPHGSARKFLTGSIPPWLSRWWIDEDLRYWTDHGIDWRTAYMQAYAGRELTEDEKFLVDRMTWFQPTRVLPKAGPDSIERALSESRREEPEWTLGIRSKRAPWTHARVGLMRELCGLTYDEIGVRTERAPSTIKRSYDAHRELLARDRRYSERFAAIASRAILLQQSSTTRLLQEDFPGGR